MRFLKLLFFCFAFSGCQLKPVLLNTPEQVLGSNPDRFFIHPIQNQPMQKNQHKHFFLDGVELLNLKEMDSRGLKMSPGEHEILVTDDGAPGKVQTFRYRASEGMEHHLLFCPENGRILLHNSAPGDDLVKVRAKKCSHSDSN